MKLFYKLFLAFFITNITLVGLMLAVISVNFSFGFKNFVVGAENKHIAHVKLQLIDHYRQHKNWQEIVNNIDVWRDIVDPQAHSQPKIKKEPAPPAQSNPLLISPRPLKINKSFDFLRTGRRLSLYDKSENAIVGRKSIQENPQREAIILNGQTIGWLGLVPSKMVKDSPASKFLTQQVHNYFLIALATIFIAFTMALLLSQHLVVPIKQLITGTNQLIEGHFNKRIKKITNDELGILSDNFNELAHTLEKNQQKRFQWMSDTSHELRTPLTILRSHLLAIQDGVFEADENRISLFINQIDNLNRIVDDLHQLSNSDIGALTYKKTQINPIEIIKWTVENFKAKFKEKNINMDYSSLSTCGTCIALGDKDRLQQLFSNLLENSWRYTNSGGDVRIYVSVIKGQLHIIFEDSAPGVTIDEQEQLFERFYRVEKSRNRNHGGSGLGLSICKKIVEAHQGTISATPSQLGGILIKIYLPI